MTVADKAKQALAKSGNGNAPVKAPATLTGMKSNQVQDLLEAYKLQIANAIPKHLTPERVIQVATTLIVRNPDIAACTTASLIGAVMASSMLGFEPIPQLGSVYFVPFNNKGRKEVQFIIGYRGMIQLARRSGEVETIYAEAVFENDSFSYTLGLNPDIKHDPATGNRGAMTHVYAVMKYKEGGFNFIVMSRADVDKIRSRSQASKSSFSPWNSDYEQMAKKTVIRQLFKYAPISVELQKNVITDGAVIDPNTIKDGTLPVEEMEVEEGSYEDVTPEENDEQGEDNGESDEVLKPASKIQMAQISDYAKKLGSDDLDPKTSDELSEFLASDNPTFDEANQWIEFFAKRKK